MIGHNPKFKNSNDEVTNKAKPDCSEFQVSIGLKLKF